MIVANPNGAAAQGTSASATSAATTGAGRAPARFLWFYHGTRGTSGFLLPAAGGSYTLVPDRVQRLELPAGSMVCMAVRNGYLLNYSYGFDVTVDSTVAALPDLSAQATMLGTLLPASAAPKTSGDERPGATGRPKPPAGPVWGSAIATFASKVRDSLERDMSRARSVAALADTPEELVFLGRPREAKAGFMFARDSLLAFSRNKGRLNDPQLKETLAGWGDDARKAAGSDSIGLLAATAILAYADALRDQRDKLVTAFQNADESPEACAKVGEGRTTMSFRIAPKDTAAKLKRALSKDLAFEVVNEAPYQRPLVSIAPVAFGVTAPGAPEFVVDNGYLRNAGARVHYRLGAIIAFNRWADGPFHLFGTSYGIGIGSEGNEAPISDLFGALLFSVGDVIGARSAALRVGLGFGASFMPDRVKGFQANEAFPTTAGKVEDLYERAWKPALYLTFALPGLSLGGK